MKKPKSQTIWEIVADKEIMEDTRNESWNRYHPNDDKSLINFKETVLRYHKYNIFRHDGWWCQTISELN